MKQKILLYPNEQKLIREKLINILELDEHNSITLYELENHPIKTKQIMELLPEIRKFCSMSKITAFSTPEKVGRPWLSIIRHMTKKDYEMVSADWRIKQENNIIRTKRYYFHKRL
jgi:hypothetical protein